MRTRNLLRHLFNCLALFAGLIAGPAWGAGTKPQTLTWTGTTNAILALNTPFRYFRLLKP